MQNILTNFSLNLELYKKMFLIRKTEALIQLEYPNNEMKTPMHMSTGSEAIEAGVTQAVGNLGLYYVTYRSHALYLALTQETDDFFIELYGKYGRIAGGKSGSMHLACPEKRLMMTSAVVGTTIPLAVGSALASKMQNNKEVTVVFFGDGATDEGVFWESLNAACLWKLPVMLVCQDNELAIHTPTSQRRGYLSLTNILSKFECTILNAKHPTDAREIYGLAKRAVEQILNQPGPIFLNLQYYRYLEHVGINKDFHEGYRHEEEFYFWLKKDPVNFLRELLVKDFSLKDIEELEEKIEKNIRESILKAQQVPFPDREKTHEGVYHV